MEQSSKWGQAMFIRQGLVAWMKALSPTNPSSTSVAPEIANSTSPQPIVIEGDLRRQLTRELVNIIQHQQPKVAV
jgi:hypothetical protein